MKNMNINPDYFIAVKDANEQISLFLEVTYQSLQKDTAKRAIAYYGHVIVHKLRQTISDGNSAEVDTIRELTERLKAL